MKFIEDIKKGIGIMFGMILVLGILFGVYAFVEPTQGPNVGNNYINKLSPVGKVQWTGYTTSTYNGNLNSFGGPNSICNTDYPGSRAMNYNDWLELGNKYPNNLNMWLIDGSYTYGANQVSKDGYATSTALPLSPQCAGWTNGLGGAGPYIGINSKVIQVLSCTSIANLGCVY